MIVSAFPFLNEIDLLEIRCRELAGVVDKFVLIESSMTWTGIRKPLHFRENLRRFEGFPIESRVLDLPEVAESPWDRELVTHTALLDLVREINPEIAIWTDADEIPKASTVERFRAMGVPAAHIDMDFVIYFFDRLDVTKRPTTAKIGYFDRTAPWHPWRGEFHHPVIPDAGWHFDYFKFGETTHLLEKLDATCHACEIGEMRRSVDLGGYPGFERTAAYPADRLPAFVRDSRARFARAFFNP